VCADDTANVIVQVDPSCDYLSIEEVVFTNMSIFPNPTNGSVFVTNEGSNEVFNFELTDLNGKVIAAQDAAINGTETTEVSLTNLESGFYLIRVFNDNADKTFRIIKE
ncbi:MAG: T9SS type A sorting domain-containing protein, partial [Crocinitomicaceae bacterium]|nr:T9SS type A sorting domain-containing protein [Crocinitomicaceae bacterium]